MKTRVTLWVTVFVATAWLNARAGSFSDTNWISLGGLPGANGPVYASVSDDAGNLYIGGDFSQAGDVLANNIAKWDGNAWSALGAGMNGSVRALAVSGSSVYVGGTFTTAGGVAATNVARWDGTVWSALGAGIGGDLGDPFNPPTVHALAVLGSDVYAGGYLTTRDGIGATNIAKWDGSTWSALGSGVGGGFGSYPPVVRALAVSGSDVYAGGDFTTAGGIAANYIAKWDGSTWSTLGSGIGGGIPFVSTAVAALAASGSNVYAGGYFTTAGGSPATTIARWDGTAWSALGSGVDGTVFPPNGVTALAVSGNDLYAGWTTNVGCAAGGCAGGGGAIAKWNGSTWSPLGPEPGGVPRPAVYALAAAGSNLFAGGYFTTAGGTVANYVARWDGATWSALGPGMGANLLVSQGDPRVMALAVSGTNLYAGGNFVTAGDHPANYIARWNGTAWSALGSGVGGIYNPSVYGLAVSGENLYVGGYFTTAGDIPANYVAKWDGSAWSALGSGLNYTVMAMAVSGTNLFAGGGFTTPGGVGGGRIAKWDGTAWSALGSGMDDDVYALVVSGTNLFAAGYFTTAGGIAANHIARWDGSTWSALGSGMNSPVVALAVSGSNLYAGGYFTTAGGIVANRIAKWDGSTWSTLGLGVGDVPASITGLAVSGGDLYAGGYFTTAGEIAANSIAKWDGSGWSPLGSGVGGTYNPSVYALAVSGDDLYVGGNFTTAGGKVSAYAAKAIIGPPPFYIVTTNSSFGFSAGRFSFTLIGPAGSNAVVFASANLQTWTPLITNPLTGGSLHFTDTLATNFTRRFYRALLQP